MKRRFPAFSLNKVPTLRDWEFGKIATQIALDHFEQVEKGASTGETLSEKIAAALKAHRIKQRVARQSQA